MVVARAAAAAGADGGGAARSGLRRVVLRAQVHALRQQGLLQLVDVHLPRLHLVRHGQSGRHASGLAGEDAVLRALLAPGDHVVVPSDAYGGTYRLFNKVAKPWGVDVVDVRITRADYVDAITESVYRRMEAERKRVANELRSTGAAEGEKIRADADRQREVTIANAYREAQKIKGQGDSQAARIYNESFGRDPQFAQFYRSLDAYKASFAKKSDVMVLDPSNSDFFKTMRGNAVPASVAAPAKK